MALPDVDACQRHDVEEGETRLHGVGQREQLSQAVDLRLDQLPSLLGRLTGRPMHGGRPAQCGDCDDGDGGRKEPRAADLLILERNPSDYLGKLFPPQETV